MGITIHYWGKAKSLSAIDELIDTLAYFAEEQSWEHWLVNENLKGPFYPNWGHGYGYIPKRRNMKKDGIEYFPKMVSSECNGYFHLYDTRFAEEVRRILRQGKRPTFFIDTVCKGISINLHPRCETLKFCFDLNTLDLANYITSEGSKGVTGFNGFHCKTQFAGFETHRTVCALIKSTKRYIDYSAICDEAGYYDSQNEGEAKKEFEGMRTRIESFGAILKKIGKERGVEVKVGTDE